MVSRHVGRRCFCTCNVNNSNFGRKIKNTEIRLKSAVGRSRTEPTKCPTLSRAHKMTVPTVIAGQVMHIRTTVEQP